MVNPTCMAGTRASRRHVGLRKTMGARFVVEFYCLKTVNHALPQIRLWVCRFFISVTASAQRTKIEDF